MSLRVDTNGSELFWQDSEDNKVFSLSFVRTLRVPDDGRVYPLPSGMGTFPIKKVSDYKNTVPEKWLAEGGVFIPLYQREAAWINLESAKPVAVKVAAGKVNAISGETWVQELKSETTRDGKTQQDYMVTGSGNQQWLDGHKTDNSTVRQFVAMPLGSGATVEGQITGEEKHGGFQIVAFAPKAGKFPEIPQVTYRGGYSSKNIGASVMDYSGSGGGLEACSYSVSSVMDCYSDAPAMKSATLTSASFSSSMGGLQVNCSDDHYMPTRSFKGGQSVQSTRQAVKSSELGLAAGGKIEQEIKKDRYGIETWDTENFGRVFIHIVNSAMWEQITGEKAPESPVSARSYTQAGFPWYSLYDEGTDVVTAPSLKNVKSLGELDDANNISVDDNAPLTIKSSQVVELGSNKNKLDGTW